MRAHRIPNGSIPIVLIALMLTSFGAVAGEGERPEPAFHVALEADSLRPTLVGARYDVEVYGGMASAMLSLEYHNTGENETRAVYFFAAPGSVRLGPTRLGIDGEIRDLVTREIEAEKQARRAPETESRKFLARHVAQRGADNPAEAARLERLYQLNRQSLNKDQSNPSKPAPPTARTAQFGLPGATSARIDTGFQFPLTLGGGKFRLVLPAVIDAREGDARARKVDAVPLRIVVSVNHPERLLAVRSPSHEILYDFAGDRTIVETVQTEVPGDRPFELEFALASEHESNAAGFVGRMEHGRREIVTVLTPPEKPLPGSDRPKELIFLVDTSGSMARETKMKQARKAVGHCVDRLRAGDRFNIIEFDGEFEPMHPGPVEPTEDEREAAHDWLDRLVAEGKTLLVPALEAALAQLKDRERHRMIIVVTDGALQDEAPALKLLHDELGDIRLFAVGAGDHVQQATLLRLAESGRGAAAFANDADSFEAAVAELFDRVSEPLGWDLEFDWGGADVESILPARLPDLYAGRPVRVVAWVRGDLPSGVRVKMSTTDGDRRFDVRLPPMPLP